MGHWDMQTTFRFSKILVQKNIYNAFSVAHILIYYDMDMRECEN